MNLYQFSKLDTFLNNLGFLQAGEGSFKIIRRNLSQGMQRGEIIIRPNGIFCTIDGREHRGYIFNQKPDISSFGEPKFHAADCDIVQNRSKLGGDYIWTNTETVQLYDRGKGGIAHPQAGILTSLMLCSKCRSIIRSQAGGITTTGDFHQYLLSLYGRVDIEKPVKTDIYGYTFDFKMISRRYRESKSYTCEQCQIDLSDRKFRKYLHVHHRSGRKTDNRLDNLECLCIRCHASVDLHHTDNFSKRANRRDLKEFNELF